MKMTFKVEIDAVPAESGADCDASDLYIALVNALEDLPADVAGDSMDYEILSVQAEEIRKS